MSESIESPNASRPGSAQAVKRTGVSSRVRESGKEASSRNSMRTRVPKNHLSDSVFRCNVSADGSCSSDSSGSFSSVRSGSFRGRRKQNGLKCGKVAPDGFERLEKLKSVSSMEKKRCGWITPSSDPLYVSFHDEEWGVPVHDDAKLFELLVLSEALGELSWPTILSKRDTFRKLFDNFDPVSIAEFSEKKILSLAGSGSALLSEPKLRAIVENARQILKVKEEFGSFSNYCWRFVNHKPIVNGFRYARNVPVKTPKAEVISKDMMKRGFRCVGPTIVYSFMQAAGIVNDHISSCFRYKECHPNVKKDCAAEVEEMDKLVKSAEQACLLQA
ncbi:hypothetical protein AAC387_Pa02g0608 [Persea americana]